MYNEVALANAEASLRHAAPHAAVELRTYHYGLGNVLLKSCYDKVNLAAAIERPVHKNVGVRPDTISAAAIFQKSE